MIVMLDRPRSEVKWNCTGYPLHSPVSPSLPLPCLTVCHQVPNELYHWTDFRGILYRGLAEILSRKSRFILNRIKISGTLREDQRVFCCRRHKVVMQHCYATPDVFMLTVTRNSTIHRERIVAFQWQQWLHERATVLLPILLLGLLVCWVQ